MRYILASGAIILVACLATATPNEHPVVAKASPVKVDLSALRQWQASAFTNVQVFAAFVPGDKLVMLDPFFGDLPELPKEIKSKQNQSKEIYLVTLCRPRANPGKTILSAKATVKVHRFEMEFDIIRGSGFMVSGQCYSVTKVVSSSMAINRNAVLDSKPKIKITKAFMK